MALHENLHISSGTVPKARAARPHRIEIEDVSSAINQIVRIKGVLDRLTQQ
ncbi:hypothetical protein [Streptomyces sp. JNUCC 63]